MCLFIGYVRQSVNMKPYQSDWTRMRACSYLLCLHHCTILLTLLRGWTASLSLGYGFPIEVIEGKQHIIPVFSN